MQSKPYIITFPKIGSEETGYLVPFDNIPFPIAHSYCIGPVSDLKTRGDHAKIKNNQVLIALGGKVEIWLESPDGIDYRFTLSSSNEGLFVPGGYWRKARLSPNCFLLSLHSHTYDADDYIRDYEEFKRINNR